MSDNTSIISFGNKGYIALLDSIDFYRCVPICIDSVDYGIRPCDAKWAEKSYGDGRRYLITQVVNVSDEKVGIALHRLLFEGSTKRPINRSFLDCRRANWIPVSKNSRRCIICGKQRKLTPVEFDDVHVFHDGKVVLLQPCSQLCYDKATKAIASFTTAIDVSGDRVYFVENFAQTRIKIGFSSDVKRRIGSLQTGCHERIVFVGSIPGSMDDEKRWHAEWRPLRVTGEWFSSRSSIREAIEHALGRKHW